MLALAFINLLSLLGAGLAFVELMHKPRLIEFVKLAVCLAIGYFSGQELSK
jgi:hypothetical protein